MSNSITKEQFTRQYALDLAARFIAEGYRIIGNRIGVVREPAADKSRGGIIIPDEAKRQYLRGRIVAIGEGVVTKLEDLPVGNNSMADRSCIGLRLGDYVTFTKYGGILHDAVWSDGEEMQIEVMHTADIYIVGK